MNTFSFNRIRLTTSIYHIARATFRTFGARRISPPLSMICTASTQSHAFQNLSRQHLKIQQGQWRGYAHVTAAEMTKAKVTERVMLVIKLFEKINAEKLTIESHFMKELGLDSLDHVELVMAVEDEFGFEIPDQEAEKLHKPSDIVKYLCEKLQVSQ